MNINNIGSIIASAVTLGMINYRTMIEPASDRMKQREAKRYLAKLGFKSTTLDYLTEIGLVHRKKDGEGNSPVYYSAKEIQSAVLAVRVKQETI